MAAAFSVVASVALVADVASAVSFPEVQIAALESVGEKGILLTEVSGPACLGDRIAVVGSDLAGIHMAWLLKKEGFNRVTVFDKDKKGSFGPLQQLWHRRVAGYSHGGEETLLDPQDREDDETGYARLLKDLDLLQLVEYPPSWIVEVEKYNAQLVDYVRLHKSLLGDTAGGLPNRPELEIMREFEGSFKDFLDEHELSLLAEVFDNLPHAMGRADDISAFQGALYMTPSLIANLDNLRLSVNQNGQQGVLESMIDDQQIDVRRDTEVTAVFYDEEALTVTLVDGRGDEERFDFVVWADPLGDYATAAEDPDDLLTSSRFLYSATAFVDVEGDHRMSPVVAYPTDPDISLSEDLYAVSHGMSGGPEYNARRYLVDGLFPLRRTLAVHGRSVETPVGAWKFRREVERVLAEEENGGAGSVVVVDVVVNKTPYWDTERSNSGYDLWKKQGERGVWFVGGAASVPTTSNVVKYNNQLVDNMIPVDTTC